MTTFEAYREPLRATLTRTILIAVVVGLIPALILGGGLARWPVGIAMTLWPSFGGHWVEIWFLNRLRPRLPVARAVQIGARLATWFVSGMVLSLGMGLTALALIGFEPERWPPSWLGGLAFIVVELVAHLPLQWRGRPSFYNGRG